jgi:hypothetical protein
MLVASTYKNGLLTLLKVVQPAEQPDYEVTWCCGSSSRCAT